MTLKQAFTDRVTLLLLGTRFWRPEHARTVRERLKGAALEPFGPSAPGIYRVRYGKSPRRGEPDAATAVQRWESKGYRIHLGPAALWPTGQAILEVHGFAHAEAEQRLLGAYLPDENLPLPTHELRLMATRGSRASVGEKPYAQWARAGAFFCDAEQATIFEQGAYWYSPELDDAIRSGLRTCRVSHIYEWPKPGVYHKPGWRGVYLIHRTSKPPTGVASENASNWAQRMWVTGRYLFVQPHILGPEDAMVLVHAYPKPHGVGELLWGAYLAPPWMRFSPARKSR